MPPSREIFSISARLYFAKLLFLDTPCTLHILRASKRFTNHIVVTTLSPAASPSTASRKRTSNPQDSVAHQLTPAFRSPKLTSVACWQKPPAEDRCHTTPCSQCSPFLETVFNSQNRLLYTPICTSLQHTLWKLRQSVFYATFFHVQLRKPRTTDGGLTFGEYLWDD